MMRVVVEDRDTVPLAGFGKAAIGPATKAFQAPRGFFPSRDRKLERDRNRGRRVQRIVMSRHRQREVVDEGRAAGRPFADQAPKTG